MKRVFEAEAEYTKMNTMKVIDRFCKKYDKPEWKEVFEWMFENGIEECNDTVMADGTRNNNWCYSLHLEVNDSCTYICLIERA